MNLKVDGDSQGNKHIKPELEKLSCFVEYS